MSMTDGSIPNVQKAVTNKNRKGSVHLACAVLWVPSSVPKHFKNTNGDIKKAYNQAMHRGEMNNTVKLPKGAEDIPRRM